MERVGALHPMRRWIIGFLLVVAVSTVFPPALMLAIWMLRSIHSEIRAGVISCFHRVSSARWLATLPVLVPVAIIGASGGIAAPDDVLRHVTAWRHQFDYREIYPYLDDRFPAASMWVGYEWLTGWLHRGMGLAGGIWMLQCILLVAVTDTLRRVFLRLIGPREDAAYWSLFLVVACLSLGVMDRVVSARPEMLMTIWALSAVWMAPWVWLGVGILLQPMYWLAGIYIPALILLRTSWVNKLWIGCVLFIWNLAFWILYSEGEWFNFFGLLREWVSNRAAPVGENATILLLLGHPLVWGIIALIVALPRIPKAQSSTVWTFLLLAAWFMLPDQIRYAGLVISLLLAAAVQLVQLPDLRFHGRWVIYLASIALLASLAMQIPKWGKTMPEFSKLGAGDIVLTSFSAATFYLPARFPGVRVAPAMELGATDTHLGGDPLMPSQAIQRLSLSVTGKEPLDCELLTKRSKFTHVVERGTVTEHPNCLELKEAVNGWRLWRVQR